MNKSLEDIEFVIFDTETTGLEPEAGDKIIEIAAIRVKGDTKIDVFESLINPLRPLPESAQRINHITYEMVKDSPTIDKVMPKFLDFIRGSCLCAYNADFDFNFLKEEIKNIPNLDIPKVVVVDLLRMCRVLMPGLSSYSLDKVAEYLCIKPYGVHRALFDAETSFEIFKKLKKLLLEKGVSDFVNFSNLFSINNKTDDPYTQYKLSRIQEAINLGATIKINYFSSHNVEVSEREVIPKQIKQLNDKFYLVGYCLLRNEERTFNIDGILHLEIL